MIKVIARFGLLGGAAIAISAAAFYVWNPSADWAKMWAGAAAQVGTLFAGWLAWHGTQKQIIAHQQSFDQQRQMRLAAERAMLPDALARIISLCDARISYLINESGSKPADGIDTSVSTTLKGCIEVSTGNAQRQLIDLVAIGQIAGSWSSSNQELAKDRDVPLAVLLRDDASAVGFRSHARVTEVFNWAALRARAGSLYRFSYGIDDDPDWATIQEHFALVVRNLCYGGLNTGFLLTDHTEYARRVEAATGDEGYAFCRQDWRKVSFA